MSAVEKLAALVIVAIGFFLWGYHTGKTVTRGAHGAAQNRTVEKAIDRHDRAAEAGNAVEKKAARAEFRQETHTRKLIQENRAYAKAKPDAQVANAAADCSLDAFRMYRWRAANRGAPVDSSGTPDGAAAGTAAAAGESGDRGSDGEPHRGGGDVSPPAGTLPRFDPVAGDD